jgi:uncharacterized membrane protein (UPF0127 family)
MPVWLFAVLFAVLIAALLASMGAASADEKCAAAQAKQVRIGAQTFDVEVAFSEAQRARGLSGRSALAPGSGLWFVFPVANIYGFWMHEMRFPIDLIWVSPELKVSGAISLQPCDDKSCPVHYAPSRVAYVLEVNVSEFAGKPGDRVTWRCSPETDL